VAQLHGGSTLLTPEGGSSRAHGSGDHLDATLSPFRAEGPSLPGEKAEDKRIQRELDGFRDRFAGPYTVDGKAVSARPMFRMNVPNAANHEYLKVNGKELERVCAKAGIGSYAALGVSGRCSPQQLVKVTQALLDAGKLPPADAEHQTMPSRIRLMQWQHGIGVDCAGYTQQAAAAVHGAAGRPFTKGLMGDMFTGMGNDPRFAKIAPESIRPGDVIHLQNPEAGQVGHNVIVYAHTTLKDDDRAKLIAAHPIAQGFLTGAGPFHTYEVDSSWGAGEGKEFGGFRRDTWIYDQSSQTWASYVPQAPRSAHDPNDPNAEIVDRPRDTLLSDPLTGPQGELFAGAYRPKDKP
jgi:hypothetical protein